VVFAFGNVSQNNHLNGKFVAENDSNRSHSTSSDHQVFKEEKSISGSSESVLPTNLGFSGPVRAVVVGARGGVGAALCSLLLGLDERNEVLATSRDLEWCAATSEHQRLRRVVADLTDDESIVALRDAVERHLPAPNLVVNCSGLLHDGDLQPERTWRNLERESMHRVFDVQVYGPALLVRYLLPLMPRNERGVFASLSARVGSIEDNRLGGWFSYRASKAAQNMVLKTASIEAARRWPKLVVLALHPGTVDTDLSAPFSARVPEEKLFSAAQAARYLASVIGARGPEDSGGFFAWDGKPIPW